MNDSTNIALPLFGGIFTLAGIIIVISSAKKLEYEKDKPAIQQANGLYNNADVVNTLKNNQTINQPMAQTQVTQSQQVSQYQQPIAQLQQPVVNQPQKTTPQTTNYPKQQTQINNQNNMNSNL